jgi:PAS domain S-box-containing protein
MSDDPFSIPSTPLEQSEKARRAGDETFRLLVDSVQDYAIFMLNPAGIIMTWNTGAQHIKGYTTSEIIGQHFSKFYSREAREGGWPERELEIASSMGRFADEGWRVKKDGTTFWASVVITALRDGSGNIRGFSKVTRDLTERKMLEQRTQELNRELKVQMAQLRESRTQLELRTMELQRISAQLVRVQDEERRRIARELHDDLGQQLIALKMKLDTSEQFTAREEAENLIDGALSKVRNLSYVLHPPLLDESGLLAALHLFFDGLRKRGSVQITFDYKPVSFARMTSDLENCIFRVIQEAITNVQRHAASPDARVELHQQTDRVLVRIRDFGKGMPLGAKDGNVSAPLGVGISGMRERVNQLGGELNVFRAEPGTLVEAALPLFQ